MPLVAGVDSSTSGCKVEVRDAETGSLLGSGRGRHPSTTPPRSEQDPWVWEAALEQACHEAGVYSSNRPDAVSIAAQQHGLVVTDEIGKPLRPAKLWNDTESAPDAAALIHALDGGAAAWALACGSVPLPSFTITKLRWLRRSEPRIFEHMEAVLLPHDWLTARLTGRRTTDRGDASGTGYWSPKEERYRLDLLGLVDDRMEWEPKLPAVLKPFEVAGEWPAVGALVGPGTGDNMAAALGVGLRAGDLLLSFGTSATASRISETATSDATGSVAGFADATGHFLPLVCTMNATKVIDAVVRLLGTDLDGFTELALDAPAGAHGLVLVPHFDGERTPSLPDATGTLSGIRSDVTPSLLARAAVEGVVCNLLDGADALGERPPDSRIILIGGGARSQAVRQVVADLTGSPVSAPDDSELVARGAAVQAAAVLLRRDPVDVWTSWSLGGGRTVEPNPSVDRETVRARYSEAVARTLAAGSPSG
jgi:xylulokinase